jgi:hypothetical protein
VDVPGNDGSTSMPEQVQRPNPWRKMMMMIYICLQVEYHFFVKLQSNLYFLDRFSKKNSQNIKFNEDLSSRCRVVTCRQTDSVQKTICCNSASNAPDDGLCTRNMSS